MLNALIDQYCNSKPPMPLEQSSQQAYQAVKNLWQSIRQKVFPNYSTKGYRSLVEWINHKMTLLTSTEKLLSQEVLNSKPVKERVHIAEELSDDETAVLGQLCDVITIISMGRQKNEEEANQLIKLPSAESFGQGTSSEFVLVLP